MIESTERYLELQDIYNQGYSAYYNGTKEYDNPYKDTDAEWWSDGWSDAMEDG